MRVIAGKYRGAVLNEFKGNDIRPTADRTKEAVFNILQSDIEGSVCLDLFCGTGNLGIEALSRGAKEVVFTDCARVSVEITKQNLLKVKEKAEVLCVDAINYLCRTNKRFDIIFIDPPYADDISERAVKTIFERKLLTENGIIVFERDKPFVPFAGATVFKQRKYGKAVVSFIREEKKCLFAGTFDPLTVGHEQIIAAALEKYDLLHLVIMSNPDKTPMFSFDERIDILKSVFESNERVVVNSWSGLLIDYMRENKIVYNVRGIRSDADMAYEKVMEEYNTKAYPEIVYDYIYSNNLISSTEVRERLTLGEEIGDLVSLKVLRKIQECRR